MLDITEQISMAEKKEKPILYKNINLGLLVFHLAIPVTFFSFILFVPELPEALASNLRLFFIPAVVGFIYYFVYKRIAEKNSIQANYGLFVTNFLYAVLAIHVTGGIGSPVLFAFYFLIAISYFVSTWYGIAASLFSVSYLFFDIFINGKESFIANPLSLWPQVIPLTLISVPFFFIGLSYRKSATKTKGLIGMTERLSTDKNLEEAIFTSITDGIYAVDNERNIILFNKAAEEMTDMDTKSAMGLKCWTVMKLKNTEKTVSVCEKSCPMLASWNQDEGIARDDLCIAKRGKNNLQISGAYSSIKDLNGKITGGVCIFRDVTKRKEVERLRTEFVSTASHELRTPITALEGYIDLASNKKISKIDEKAKEYLDKAHETVLNMSSLVKNLLSVTRIDEGRIEKHIENFSIAELIETTVFELKRMADKKSIDLRFKKTSTGEKGKKALARAVNVAADKSMVKEVLNNLIENGIKFTKKGDVTISVSFDKEFATIAVEDTGAGIPKTEVKHLFQKFYQIDNSATREVGGTGLGLYITRSILEELGGTIWVESKIEKGTTFFFTLPRALA